MFFEKELFCDIITVNITLNYSATFEKKSFCTSYKLISISVIMSLKSANKIEIFRLIKQLVMICLTRNFRDLRNYSVIHGIIPCMTEQFRLSRNFFHRRNYSVFFDKEFILRYNHCECNIELLCYI